METYRGYSEFLEPVQGGWDTVPTSSAQQSCALCGFEPPSWVHLLDINRNGYRQYGKGFTLAEFWTLCDGCEQQYVAHDDAGLVALMKTSGGWQWESQADIASASNSRWPCSAAPTWVAARWTVMPSAGDGPRWASRSPSADAK